MAKIRQGGLRIVPANELDDEAEDRQVRRSADGHAGQRRSSLRIVQEQSLSAEARELDPEKRLREHLAPIPPGPIQESGDIVRLLAACWHRFGGDNGGMNAYKLAGRAEDVLWEPPVLSFRIERHGGIVGGGSSRAEMQRWDVNVETMVREYGQVGHRQIHPMQPRLNVKPIAEQVASAILHRQDDQNLKWYSGARVRVCIGQIIPDDSAVKQTVRGRRRRFWKELDALVAPHWIRRTVIYTDQRIS